MHSKQTLSISPTSTGSLRAKVTIRNLITYETPVVKRNAERKRIEKKKK